MVISSDALDDLNEEDIDVVLSEIDQHVMLAKIGCIELQKEIVQAPPLFGNHFYALKTNL